MYIVDKYRVVLLAVVIAFFGSFCVLAANSAPFSDSFDDYANGSAVDGNNGWLAGSTVVATNSEANTNVFAIGTNSCYIPTGEAATNETQAAVSSNVWVDFYAQVQLMDVAMF